MAYEVDSKTLPNVARESITKDGSLLIIPFPRADAASAAIFDFLGCTQRIVIEGIATGAEIATFLDDFFGGADLEGGVLHGKQTKVTYTGSNSISVSVKVEQISAVTQVTETDNIMRYTVKLIMAG